MAKKKFAKSGSKRAALKRRAIMAGLVVLILYIGVQVISRTDGIRKAVADKISNGTRLPVSLEKCGTTPLLGLRLKGLAFPGVEMPDVELVFSCFSFFSKEKPFVKKLRLRDAELRFRRIPASGQWEPLVLHGVARRLGAVMGLNPGNMQEEGGHPVFPPYAINEKTRLELRKVKVSWLDEKGRELAYILDGRLDVMVAGFKGKKAAQTIAECGQIRLASGRVLDDFRLEAFRVEGSAWVTVLQMSDSEGQYDEFASRTFWQDLSLFLNQLSAVE